MAINPSRKLELSPEALAALKLPLYGSGWVIRNAENRAVMTIDAPVIEGRVHDTELAHFIAALVNEALAPACEPEKAAA